MSKAVDAEVAAQAARYAETQAEATIECCLPCDWGRCVHCLARAYAAGANFAWHRVRAALGAEAEE